MASSIKKKLSFNKNKTTGTAAQESTNRPKVSKDHRHHDEMPPDKEVEENALHACFTYISNNLPPDDVAMEMNSRDLLTKAEHSVYLSMKQTHTSDITKSEYLLQCLGKREAGFLTQFCEILRGIKQASYLVDDITKAYKTASHQLVSNSRLGARDRSSKLSLSDADLYLKGAQECTRCKILEEQNRKLERRCRQLKEQQKFYHATFLPIKCLSDITEKQLERAQKEGDKLKQLLPLLQMTVAQTTSEISAIQTSLQKLSDLLTQEKDWAISTDDSARSSMISDGSLYGIEACSNGASRYQTHESYQTGSTATDLQQIQSTNGHQSQMTQATTNHNSTDKRRTKSASADREIKGLQLRHVASDVAPKSGQVVIKDTQLQSILKQRKEHVDTMSRRQQSNDSDSDYV